MIGPHFNLDPTPIWDRGSKDKLTADRHDLLPNSRFNEMKLKFCL